MRLGRAVVRWHAAALERGRRRPRLYGRPAPVGLDQPDRPPIQLAQFCQDITHGKVADRAELGDDRRVGHRPLARRLAAALTRQLGALGRVLAVEARAVELARQGEPRPFRPRGRRGHLEEAEQRVGGGGELGARVDDVVHRPLHVGLARADEDLAKIDVAGGEDALAVLEPQIERASARALVAELDRQRPGAVGGSGRGALRAAGQAMQRDHCAGIGGAAEHGARRGGAKARVLQHHVVGEERVGPQRGLPRRPRLRLVLHGLHLGWLQRRRLDHLLRHRDVPRHQLGRRVVALRDRRARAALARALVFVPLSHPWEGGGRRPAHGQLVA